MILILRSGANKRRRLKICITHLVDFREVFERVRGEYGDMAILQSNVFCEKGDVF